MNRKKPTTAPVSTVGASGPDQPSTPPRLSWLERVKGSGSYPCSPKPKPFPENVYDPWKGLPVPSWQRKGQSMNQFLAIAKIFPQNPEPEIAAEKLKQIQNIIAILKQWIASAPKEPPVNEAKSKPKSKPGRRPGMTAKAKRSAQLTVKMMRQGLDQQVIADRRKMKLNSLRQELRRYRLEQRTQRPPA
jgi:hypothetical protein